MEIIRRATTEEMMTLEGITLDAEDMMTTIIKVTIVLFIIASLFSIALESTPLFIVSMTLILIASLSRINHVETHIMPEEQATYDDHPYHLAIIDNSDDFEHESYRLVDHHKDNTYFVEAIHEDENQ